MDLELLSELSIPNDTKILLLVIDGLGGLPNESGRSELEQADIPHLDRLAQESLCGLTSPSRYGVTPGSGPGHLALFGYDPERFTVGRGVLEALGIDFDLQPQDVAARGNFCTVDAEGQITDRRAGRIPTDAARRLCEQLRKIKLPGVQVFVEPVREHRFVLVLRGEGLSDASRETDPQREGAKPLPVRALAPEADADGGAGQRVDRAGAEGAAGHEPGEHADAARLREAPAHALDRRDLQVPRRRDRRLPDVPRPGEAGRHGRAARPARRSPTRSRR